MLKLLIILLSTVLFCSSFFAQNEGEDMAAAQNAWMEYMTPGPMHEMMAKSVGEWNTKSSLWMNPGGEPLVTEGKATAEMILGGRYLKMTHSGTIMGMPFEGISIQSYDNALGRFTGIWIDNMGTGIAITKGTYDEATKTINSVGTSVDPMTKTEITFREAIRIIDDNHQVLEMYMDYQGEEFKSMEVEYTR